MQPNSEAHIRVFIADMYVLIMSMRKRVENNGISYIKLYVYFNIRKMIL